MVTLKEGIFCTLYNQNLLFRKLRTIVLAFFIWHDGRGRHFSCFVPNLRGPQPRCKTPGHNFCPPCWYLKSFWFVEASGSHHTGDHIWDFCIWIFLPELFRAAAFQLVVQCACTCDFFPISFQLVTVGECFPWHSYPTSTENGVYR